MLKILLFLALILPPIWSCPTNQTVYLYCQCESSYNGIILDCSGKNIAETMIILRENQVQLGLIQQLILKNASMNILPDNFIKGLYVKKLDLSQNMIEEIEDMAFKGLENILQTLILNHNKLSVIPNGALDGMAALLQVDLSNNSIGNLETRQAIRNAPKIYDLNLANNQICKIQKTVFDGVKHSVQTLNLAYNCLDRVPASALRGFKQLLALHLHHNKIKELAPLAFMNLPMLNLINLAANSISNIHRQSFLNVPNMRMIYLSDNNITDLVAGQFRHFEALEMLDLTRNKIKRIPKMAFSNMSRLMQLYLGENEISAIEKDAFANSSIVLLLLPYNRLTELNADMFSSMGYLQQFSLKYNQIRKIAQNTFYHMPSLVMIDISHNELTTLPPATFLTQLNMFLVDISNNNLITTPYNAFNRRVMTVVLQENPLVCTEKVHLLQNGVGIYVAGTVDKICGGVVDEPVPPIVDDTEPFVQENIASPTAQVPATNPSRTIIRPVAGPTPPRFNVSTVDRARVTLPQGYFTRQIPTVQPNFRPGLIQPPRPPISNRGFQPPRPPIQNPGLIQPSTQPIPTVPPVYGIPSAYRPNGPNPTGYPPFQPETAPRPYVQPPDQPVATTPYFKPFWPTTTPDYRLQTYVPFPVPFLTRPTPVAPAFAATPPTTRATLPPGIIIATARPAPSELPKWTSPRPRTVAPWNPELYPTRRPVGPWQEGYTRLPPHNVDRLPESTNSENIPPITATKPTTYLPPDIRTVPPKKPKNLDPFANPDDVAIGETFPYESEASEEANRKSGTGNATTTIAICLTVVVIVMVAVFITLCVVRHRSHTKRSLSSNSSSAAARTSAYVHAQLNYSGSNFGTGSMMRPRSGPAGTPPKTGGQTWIYAPGSYTSASNYYK